MLYLAILFGGIPKLAVSYILAYDLEAAKISKLLTLLQGTKFAITLLKAASISVKV